MNQKKKITILIIGVVICIMGFILLMAFMVKQNKECIDSPLVFSAKKIKQAGGNYWCSCQSLDQRLNNFYFNETGVYQGDRLEYFKKIELDGGVLE